MAFLDVPLAGEEAGYVAGQGVLASGGRYFLIPGHRSPPRYLSAARDQTALRLRLRDLAAARVRGGYRRLDIILQREG